MRKIPTLFLRDSDHLATTTVHPDCVWVLNGEGVATVKWDGTCCAVINGELYARYTRKKNRKPPEDWIDSMPERSPELPHPGWVPVFVSGKLRSTQYIHHVTAWNKIIQAGGKLEDGTYELVGPFVQGNPYNFDELKFIRHGTDVIPEELLGNRSFKSIRFYLAVAPIEGIVFHAPDGKMAKIKRSDFGLQWPVKTSAVDKGEK
jgi:hypothetical protein